MAYVTGTATNFADLYNKLRDFLTTNATLVAAGQNWTQIAGSGGTLTAADAIVMQGPGSSGTDQILVGLRPEVSVGADTYNLGLWGLSSYVSGSPFESQPGVMNGKFLHLWNSAIPYWFFANGRRFIVVARVTSVYQSAYAGFILPYHLPTTYPYPLFVGGCSADPTMRFSQSNDTRHSAFFNPGAIGGPNGNNPAEASAILRAPDGQWMGFYNRTGGSSDSGAAGNLTCPWSPYFRGQHYRDALDGTAILRPGELVGGYIQSATMGCFDGVFYIPGFGTASEDVVTVDGKNYLVVQNTYRTNNNEYAAIAME